MGLIDIWRMVQARAAVLQPDLIKAILGAFAQVRTFVSPGLLADMIRSGEIEMILERMIGQRAAAIAFSALRATMRRQLAQQTITWAKTLPAQGQIDGHLVVSFDVLNPRVIDAVRELDTKVITNLSTEVRETVRAVTERGLREGVNPRVIARQIPDVVGLSVKQESFIQNLRNELEAGDFAAARERALLDRRFKLESLEKLSQAARAQKIDTIVASYRKNYLAFNAETNARTAALDTTKAAQRLSWEAAIDKGIVSRDRLWKTWRGVLDRRERKAHIAMEGQKRRFDERYSNGQMIPGDDEYNCRCVETYSVE